LKINHLDLERVTLRLRVFKGPRNVREPSILAREIRLLLLPLFPNARICCNLRLQMFYSKEQLIALLSGIVQVVLRIKHLHASLVIELDVVIDLGLQVPHHYQRRRSHETKAR
jgi:hypothetical protein